MQFVNISRPGFWALKIMLGLLAGWANTPFASEMVTDRILLENGNELVVKISLPTQQMKDRNRKFPTYLLFGGFETAGEVLTLIPKDLPLIVASFDYPFRGERKFRFPETLQAAPALKQSMHDTLAGIPKLVQLLKARSDVDSSHIGIIGASFGAPFAVASAARDSSIQRLVVVHGFADIQGTVQHRLQQIFRPKLGMSAPSAAWFSASLIVGYLNPPPPEVSATHLRSNQKILMIEALGDQFIPPPSRKMLWEAFQKSQAQIQRTQWEGDHLQPGSHDLVRKIVQHVLDWSKS